VGGLDAWNQLGCRVEMSENGIRTQWKPVTTASGVHSSAQGEDPLSDGCVDCVVNDYIHWHQYCDCTPGVIIEDDERPEALKLVGENFLN